MTVAAMPRLAGAFLRARRLELGIAEVTLAWSLGVSPMTLRRIEAGGDPLNYDLRFLANFADRLGISFDELFDEAGEPARAGAPWRDVERVGAALAGAGGRSRVDALAAALGWSPERTRLALDDLAVKVRPAGMRVVWAGDTEVVLGPRAGAREVAGAQVWRSIEANGVSAAEFRCIALLARSRHHNAGSDDAVVLKRLISAGVVASERTGKKGSSDLRRTEVRLTDRARFDLCLDDSA
jgi:transcriptional regulator with XRE-family HTH domain